ncbi:MAG: transposase, partial [Clostridia bacterium]|nr:transposase [Clostridia bacterium]
DMVLHPISKQNEHADAAFMVAWNDFPPCIVICDRLYASYPLIADFQQKSMDFVLRTKQGVGALKPLQALPMKELDVDIQFVLTDNQSKASKDKGHIYVNTGSKRGKVNSPKTYVSRFGYPLPYVMRLRVVRGNLPNGDLETLLTSLSRDEFSAAEVMELYRLRWREEIFFRHIKYDCGASRMKCKKEDYSRQEIYGHFITSAAVWKIINGIALEHKTDSGCEYKINIKMATYLVKKFLATPGANGEQLIADMSRYLVQVKPNRANERNLRPTSFVPFNYRVA